MRPPQARQRDELFESRAVDRVVNDVDAASTRQVHHLVAEAALVVDRMICAFFEANRAFFLSAGCGYDMSSVELCDLDRWKTDAARCAVDQDPLACFEPAALDQRVVRGVINVPKHRGLFEAHRRRDLVAVLGLRITELREGAEPMPAHNPITRPEADDVRPDGEDLTRGLAARDEGRLGTELVFSGEHQHVDVLDAARLDANLQLSGAGRRRVGHLPQRQYLRPAKRLANDCPHLRYSAACACTSVAGCERSFSITSQFV